MTRKLHEEIKMRREALGLDDDRVAQILSISSMSYFDLEFHSDEWNDVVPFHELRFVCRWFEIDLADFIDQTSGEILANPVQPHILIRERRDKLGLSEAEFADACGFYPVFTSIVEVRDGILLYPFQVSRFVCDVLKVDQKSFAQWSLLAIF